MALESDTKAKPKGQAEPDMSADVVQPKLVGDVVLAPTARVFTRWTPALIESAIRQSESGDLSAAVRICDWILRDDAVRAAFGARNDAVFALDVTFESADGPEKPKQVETAPVDPEIAPTPGVKPAPEAKPEGKVPTKPADKPDPAAEDPLAQDAVLLEPESDPVLEAIDEDWDLSYPEAELSLINIWGLLLGVAPARHETTLDPSTGRLLPCPKFFYPGTLKQDTRTEVWTVQDINGGVHTIKPGEGEWLLHCPFGTRRPWAGGLWSVLAELVLIKSYARLDWSRTSEKASLLVAEMELDKDGNIPTGYDQKVDVVGKLMSRGGDAAAAMPPGWALKLIETATNPAIFEDQITMINDAIATVIRGGNLTTQTDGGSKAAAETQGDLGDGPKRKADAAKLSTTLRQQSLVWWCAWNFGEEAEAPWPLWMAPTQAPEVNYFSFANGLKTFQDMGFTLDADTLKTDYGMSFISGYDPQKVDRQAAADMELQKAAIEAKPAGPDVKGKPPGGPPGGGRKFGAKAMAARVHVARSRVS